MERIEKWTVARFPNGSWTTGGSPYDPSYEDCEIFIVSAKSSEEAKSELRLSVENR